jgi:acyl-CoA synthetase (AMP-forming)/AMP-acid ligase II
VGVRLLDRNERSEWRSWGEIELSAQRVASALARSGVGRGERVALVFPTSWGFLDGFFGTLLAGAVPTPLYPPVRLGRMKEFHASTAGMITAVNARLVLADSRTRRILGEAIDRSRPDLGCCTIDSLPEGVEAPKSRAEPDDMAIVQFSSGTTVDPKPVALSHRAVMEQVERLNSSWIDTQEMVHSGVCWLPLYHDMGLIGCLLSAMARPADMTLLPPEMFVARPASWLRAISRYQATVSPAPNFAYGLCVHKIRDEELKGVDLSSWQVALNGAETASPDVMRAFQKRFAAWGFRSKALSPVYGLSEAALAVTFPMLDENFLSRRFERESLAPGEEPRLELDGVELASVGRPLPGFSIEARDQDKRVVARGCVGRIWVRGPSMMAGYLGRPRATARALQKGWLDTGDLGFVHQGDLFLVGRATDMLIVCGRNIAPEVLERPLDDVTGVRRGCTAALSTEVEGGETERVLLFVEHDRAAGNADQKALPERCRRAALVASGVEASEVIVLAPGTLPRTSSGKIRRQETLARYIADRLKPPRRTGVALLVGELARSALAHRRARVVE